MDNAVNNFLNVVKSGVVAYTDLIKKNNYQYKVLEVDCSTLPIPVWKKGNGFPLHDFHSSLPSNKLPCLYYFEILNLNTSDVLDAYCTFRNEESKKTISRNCPTLKKHPPLKTKILYVGKVKHTIGGRMFVHFGYYHVGNTAGLQLACWAKTIGLKLNVHIFSFEESMKDFIGPLELPLARQLKPLIGKH